MKSNTNYVQKKVIFKTAALKRRLVHSWDYTDLTHHISPKSHFVSDIQQRQSEEYPAKQLEAGHFGQQPCQEDSENFLVKLQEKALTLKTLSNCSKSNTKSK